MSKKIIQQQSDSQEVTESHCLQLIRYYVRDIGLINHQIESFNDLIKEGGGFENILNKYFCANRNIVVKNSELYSYVISEIRFSNVQFEKPHIIVRSSDKNLSQVEKKPLTPTMIRKSKKSYKAEMFFDISFQLTPCKSVGDQKVTLIGEKPKDIVYEKSTYFLERVPIAYIPVMVKSKICNLDGKNAIELLDVYEDDPTDPGGYFIQKGHEWTISSTESTLYNFANIRDQGKKNDMIIKAMILSREDESGFGNSYQSHFRLYQNNLITIELNIPSFTVVEIPFQIFFRMFGVCTDQKITEYILYDAQDEGRLSNEIWNILKESFDKISSDKGSSEFEQIRDTRDEDQVTEFIGKILMKKKIDLQKISDDKYIQFDQITQESAQKTRTFTKTFFATQFLSQFSRENPEHKLLYTGLIIRQLIMRRLEIIQQTDRDSLKVKRVVTPGVQYAKQLKIIINNYVLKPIQLRLDEACNQSDFNPSKLNMKDIVTKSIDSTEINKILKSSLTTGEKIIYSKRKAVPNRISSQEQLRKNNIFTIQSLRLIQVSEGKVGSQNERAAELRQVHQSYIGYICPCQTADTGRKIGMNKQMAIMANVTEVVNSELLMKIIQEDKNIINLDRLHLPDINEKKLGKVFINGLWYGCTDQSLFKLREKYVQKRRNMEIDIHTTIAVDILNAIIYFWTDSGRLIRPLLICYTKENSEEQYVKLTQNILNQLTIGQLKFQDLIKMQIMEYISAEEQENCLIAMSLTHLRENNQKQSEEKKIFEESLKENKQSFDQRLLPIRMYTHVDIEQAIFSIAALTDPFFNHSQPQRCTFETSQVKQTCGLASLDYPFRYNKQYYLQHVCEMPLVKTITNDIAIAGGQNIVMAILISDGYNQLDSIIFNKGSVERGIMTCTFYTYEITEIEKNEFICLPDPSTQGLKQNCNYSKLDSDGIIKKGMTVVNNDILVCKKLKVNQKQDNEPQQFVDKSLDYQGEEEFIVDEVIFKDEIDSPFVLIRLKSCRPIEQGDKFSQRSGCKGTVGELMAYWNMPYTSTGIVPDVIMNPICVPTRMIVGQLLEMVIARQMSEQGTIYDGTAFQKVNIHKIIETLGNKDYEFLENKDQVKKLFDELKEAGIGFSEEILYSGKTGERMEALVFTAPCFIQRLQKFASAEFHVTAGGPRNATTRQPLEGHRLGGIKLGEMEKDAILAHGAIKFLREKFTKDSDGYDSYVCRTCGLSEIVFNAEKQIYRCDQCKQDSEIVKVPSCWSINVFNKEQESMGAGIKYNIKPKEYLIHNK